MYYVCGFVKDSSTPKSNGLKRDFPPSTFSPLTKGAEHPPGEGKKTAETCSCTCWLKLLTQKQLLQSLKHHTKCLVPRYNIYIYTYII